MALTEKKKKFQIPLYTWLDFKLVYVRCLSVFFHTIFCFLCSFGRTTTLTIIESRGQLCIDENRVDRVVKNVKLDSIFYQKKKKNTEYLASYKYLKFFQLLVWKQKHIARAWRSRQTIYVCIRIANPMYIVRNNQQFGIIVEIISFSLPYLVSTQFQPV